MIQKDLKTSNAVADAAQHQSAETIKCPNCGAVCDASAKFCASCRIKLANECLKCGHLLKNGMRFCPNCGADSHESEKSIWYYFLYVIDDQKFTFSGRASRKEFWSFQLVNFIITISLQVVLYLLLYCTLSWSDYEKYSLLTVTLVTLPYSLYVFIPGLAVTWRRFHDINKSGLFFFLCFIPVFGLIPLFELWFERGTKLSNQYDTARYVHKKTMYSQKCQKCQKCGKTIPKGWKKCPTCGTAVSQTGV